VVNAFAREGSDLGLKTSAELRGGSRTVTLTKGAWTAKDLEKFDACFLTRPVAENLELQDQSNALVWEHSPSSLVDYLEWIRNECEQHNWKRVAAVPVGYEDEGEYLREWLKGKGLPADLTIRFVDELDFADLRGWQ
jgi:hypothetical protein